MPVSTQLSFELQTLRDYQVEALDELQAAIEAGEHPVCALATGGGKSVLIAALCGRLPGRILVATHRKELLEQNSETLARWIPSADYGVYSAGLGRRETHSRIIFGGIQSVYSRLDELQQAGKFDYVMVDEAHRVPQPSIDSMYKTVMTACPGATRIGFSATPFRLDNGLIFGDEDAWFTVCAAHIGVSDLTDAGYLTPLHGVLTAANVPLDHVRKQSGEFILSDLSQSASEQEVVNLALDELCGLAQNRQSWLVFCVDVAHTELVTDMLQDRGVNAGLIVGKTPADERAALLDQFKTRRLRALVNCMVGTEGFDIPVVDCVAMLRPTLSKALCVQMLGRGTRLYDGKTDCLVLDLAGNIERHQPLDGLGQVYKSERLEEQEREEEAKAQRREQERRARHGVRASLADPRYPENAGPRELAVLGVSAKLAPSRRQEGKTNVQIQYRCQNSDGQQIWVNLWLCPEYTGWARQQARSWFHRRDMDAPYTASECVDRVRLAARPTTIVCSRDNGWDRIIMEHF